jgi:uncharacterized protein (TIGR03435 family)
VGARLARLKFQPDPIDFQCEESALGRIADDTLGTRNLDAERFFCLQADAPTHMLRPMRTILLLVYLSFSSSTAFGQASAKAFDVVSVKPCQHVIGPDYNNQLTYSPTGLTAKNATLKRLIADAYGLQLNQVSGPNWLSQNEYDVDARITDTSAKREMAQMLRNLLAERFSLAVHTQMREMRVYELLVGPSGLKIQPIGSGDSVAAHAGFHFRGDMRQFADLLALQFSIPAAENPNEPSRASLASGAQIPVIDKTGLTGTFDFNVDMHPELGTDMFTSWQRALQDQLGLKIESRKENVAVLVVDGAAKVPTAN